MPVYNLQLCQKHRGKTACWRDQRSADDIRVWDCWRTCLVHEVLPVVCDVDAAAHARAVVEAGAGLLVEVAGRRVAGRRHVGVAALLGALLPRVVLQLRIPHGLRSTQRCSARDSTHMGRACPEYSACFTVVLQYQSGQICHRAMRMPLLLRGAVCSSEAAYHFAACSRILCVYIG